MWPVLVTVMLLQSTLKLTNYCLLKDEAHRMWQTKVSIVPVATVVVGTWGIVKQGQAGIVKSFPGNCFIVKIQKNVLLGSMEISRKVLNIETLQSAPL